MKTKFLALLFISLSIIAFVLYYTLPHSFASNDQVIVIDAGHGGKDPGTTSVTGTYEKDIVLTIAFYVEEALKERGYHVVMTRTDDSFIPLNERVAIAARANAQLFISLHANALTTQPDLRGLQVLYYPDELGKNATISETFAHNLSNHLQIPNRGAIARKDLVVLRDTPMTSLLIETGFLTNEQEAKLLEQSSYQKKIARAIANTIELTINKREEDAF